MAQKQQTAIAVIGDLIDSKQIENRYEFQERFAKSLEDINLWHADSPYTLTLGDEFQALYTDAKGLFCDLFHIRECIYPVRCRFSVTIGEVTTPINSKRAIGMDGPAFHLAREMINHSKKTGNQLSVVGLPDQINAFLQPATNILWESTANWNCNRMKILRMELEQFWDEPERYGLTISERAINKNIREGQLHDWSRLIDASETEINHLLQQARK
jgi:hypothetical protein